MKLKIKSILTFVFFKLLKTHKDEVDQAKKLAEKAKKSLEQARQQFEVSEARYDESIEKIRQEMIELNDMFNKSIQERNEFNKLKEATVKIVEPKQ